MIINVKVIPNSKKNEIISGDPLKVKINSPAEKGKANKALIELLASHFCVKKTGVRIVRGEHARDKTIEISV